MFAAALIQEALMLFGCSCAYYAEPLPMPQLDHTGAKAVAETAEFGEMTRRLMSLRSKSGSATAVCGTYVFLPLASGRDAVRLLEGGDTTRASSPSWSGGKSLNAGITLFSRVWLAHAARSSSASDDICSSAM